MVDERVLEGFLKNAFKTGKCIIGTREVFSSLKGSKVVVYSASLDGERRSSLLEACASSAVPTIFFEGTSERLGRMCGKPFNVSVVAVKSPGEAKLDLILSPQPA